MGKLYLDFDLSVTWQHWSTTCGNGSVFRNGICNLKKNCLSNNNWLRQWPFCDYLTGHRYEKQKKNSTHNCNNSHWIWSAIYTNWTWTFKYRVWFNEVSNESANFTFAHDWVEVIIRIHFFSFCSNYSLKIVGKLFNYQFEELLIFVFVFFLSLSLYLWCWS